jgi:hypothetical protein
MPLLAFDRVRDNAAAPQGPASRAIVVMRWMKSTARSRMTEHSNKIAKSKKCPKLAIRHRQAARRRYARRRHKRDVSTLSSLSRRAPFYAGYRKCLGDSFEYQGNRGHRQDRGAKQQPIRAQQPWVDPAARLLDPESECIDPAIVLEPDNCIVLDPSQLEKRRFDVKHASVRKRVTQFELELTPVPLPARSHFRGEAAAVGAQHEVAQDRCGGRFNCRRADSSQIDLNAARELRGSEPDRPDSRSSRVRDASDTDQCGHEQPHRRSNLEHATQYRIVAAARQDIDDILVTFGESCF